MMRLGQVRLLPNIGQANGRPYEEEVRQAIEEVREWDNLLYRLAAVSDDEKRSEILRWIGRTDVFASPAERYAVVRDVLVTGSEPDEIFSKRVADFENVISELDTRISSAEASGTLPAPKGLGAGSTPEEGMALSKCFLGGIALLGLIVFPLVLD